MKLRGKVSWFGGPNDMGVSPSEGLAFIYQVEDAPHLFLAKQPPNTTGLARRLNPEVAYIACRWDYDVYPKPSLLENIATVRAIKTGKILPAYPADWGPHADTDRVADISPGLMEALGITTDDEVEIIYPSEVQGEIAMLPYPRIVISSGHGLHIRGASGILDEVDEARRVVDQVAEELSARGVEVTVFHDNTSDDQDENLKRIVDTHNSYARDLDISVHFNAYEDTEKEMGTEVLYVTQDKLADQVSDAIATAGKFIDRGPKYRDELYFLNNTEKPAILIETCFVDSTADAELYGDNFDAICEAIADVLTNDAPLVEKPPVISRPELPTIPSRPPEPGTQPMVYVEVAVPDGVGFKISVNGVVLFNSNEENLSS